MSYSRGLSVASVSYSRGLSVAEVVLQHVGEHESDSCAPEPGGGARQVLFAGARHELAVERPAEGPQQPGAQHTLRETQDLPAAARPSALSRMGLF